MRPVSSALLVASCLADLALGVTGAGCVTTAGRFPADVQAALAHTSMRRLETDRLVIFYPASRKDLAGRLADHLERCADVLTASARIDNRHSHEKMFIVVPEAPFNNAYVLPPIAGLQDTAVIPAGNTLDFTTEFGLPPDPASIGCHELTHYVHLKQIAGLWGGIRTIFGDVASPQLGLDAWFVEGLATYYEARMQPGLGRPRWPVFTGMFAAAYAGGAVSGGDLSESKRAAVVGNHYLVGTMFISFLAERYGDAALWRLIELQARSATIVLSVDGRFADVYGKGLGDLFAEFKAWVAERYPRRPRPAGEQVVRQLGADARWAWADSGAVAAIDADLDRDATLTVWEADGRVRATRKLVDLLPPRKLTLGDPLLISGMSFTADGRDLFFTAIDRGDTYQTTRLFRLRGDRLTELASGLGPGGTISADGQKYFHLVPDGDRWSLGAYDLATAGRATLWSAEPGQYALTVQASPDGRRLAISGWNGRRFVIWLHDATTGARIGELTGTGDQPLYQPTFAAGGKLAFLAVVDGRFQVAIGGADGRRAVVTDTAYGALAPRVVGDKLRYLAREGLRWTLVEVALTGAAAAPQGDNSSAPSFVKLGVRVEAAPAPARPARVLADGDASVLDGLFKFEERGVGLMIVGKTTAVGLTVGGRDRLDLVRWAAGGTIDVGNGDLSGAAGIELGALAPWTVAASASDQRWREEICTSAGTPCPDASVAERARRDTAAVVTVARTWRDTWGLGLSTAYRRSITGTDQLSLWGPEAGVSYVAVDGSPKAGLDRGVIATLSGGYYPRSALSDLIRARLTLETYVPLPFGRRHVLHVGGRAHSLFQDERLLLEVGGIEPMTVLWSSPDTDPDAHAVTDIVDPSGNPFTERLRGFEDAPLAAYRAGILDVDWTYPLIIDRGVTNLAFLPASFIRQLDLQVFASGVWIDNMTDSINLGDFSLHYAAGAALTLRLSPLRIPLALRYQVSRRLTDHTPTDDGWLQLLSLTPDL